MRTTASSFYVTGGTLRSDAPSYVERRADRDLYEGLSRGEFCYVLTARQMGKSSLMVRTAARLREEGVAVVVLDLTAIGQNLSSEQWYDGLRDLLAQQLDQEEELDDFWQEQARLGPFQRWMKALREVVLARVPGRIVLFVDEIDTVRSLPFSTDEFFAGIRECYNRRTEDPEFGRLTFCLLGVASPSDLIRDVRTTPFNIGRRIELTDFTEADAALLARGFLTPPPAPPRSGEGRNSSGAPPLRFGEGVGGRGQPLLRQVLYWTAGHPYLTQRLCQAVAEDGTATDTAGVDRLCEELFLSPRAREQDDNLLFVRERLLRSEADLASLLELYGKVWRGKPVRDDETNPLVSVLRLAGITRAGEGRLRVRNRIYARVFDRTWVVTHMPDAELRRQRAAFRRGLVRATAVFGVILTVVGGLALVAASQARLARRAAASEARQKRLAEERERIGRRLLYAAQMNQAQQAWAVGNVARVRELLETHRPGTDPEDLRGFEWRYLWRLCQQAKASFTFPDPHGGYCVAFSPDGRTLASGGGKRVTLWDPVTRRPVGALEGFQSGAGFLAISPDGKTLAANDAKSVKLWDLATRRLVAVLKGHQAVVRRVVFSPDGQTLASGGGLRREWGRPGEVILWDLVTKRERGTLQERQNGVWSLAFSPDGKTLAWGSDDNTVTLWDVASRRKAATLRGHRDEVISVAFSPDGKTLASGSIDRTAKLWDLATRREVATLPGHRWTVWAVAFSPDSKLLATASFDQVVKLWDVATKREIKTLKDFDTMVSSVAFSPDGRTLASGSGGTVKLWDIAAPGDADILKGHPHKVRSVAFSPDGKTLASGSGFSWGERDRPEEVKLWDVATRREVAALAQHQGGVNAVAFSPDGKTLASGSSDKTIRLWDAVTKRSIATLAGHREAVLTVAFSPDGKLLASGDGRWIEPGPPGEVKLWDVGAKREVATLRGHRADVASVAFSPDGKLLASGSWDRTVKLWDVAGRRELARLDGHAAPVNTVVFSPDGGTLAVGIDSGMVKLWDVATHRERATLKGHMNGTSSLTFSPDGKTLASGGFDNTVKLWNMATGQEVANLEGHTNAVWSVAFSPDGTILASGSIDYTIRLWRAASFAETDAPAGARSR